MKRILLLGLVGLVAIAVAGAITFAYMLTPRPISLTVDDGSAVGVIEANFANYTLTNSSIVRYFNATTYANESVGPTSALTVRMFTSTFYDAGGGWLVVDINTTVEGEFASGLHLGGLTLACNQTGQPVFVWGVAEPGAVNVSGYPQKIDNSGTFAPTLVNQTGKGSLYEFLYPAYISEQDILSRVEFLGFRATVTGEFTPAVSVGILLQIIDAPGGG